MSDPTNLAKQRDETPSPNGVDPAARASIDPDTPEAEMRLLEEEWRRFCGAIGLAEIPDIRATLAAGATEPRRRPRPSHWLVRPFVAVYDWFTTHP